MMNGKISAFQFYTILFLTRLLTTLTYISDYTDGINVSDRIFQTVFRFMFGVLITLPVLILNKKYGDFAENGIFSKAKAVIYSLVFFYFSITTVARLDLFAGTVVFPETNVSFLIVIVIAFCAYGAFLGFESIARSAVIFSVPVILSLLFVFGALIKDIDFLNLSPLLYNGVMPVVKTSANAVGRTVEYAVIAAALPCVRGNGRKGFFVWAGAQTVVTAVMFFLEATVLGNFSNMQLFPVYTLASMAKFSIFDGLEAIITGVWVLCAFLKISLLIYLQGNLLSDAFKIDKRKIILISSCLLTAISLYVSGSILRFDVVDSSGAKLVLIILSVPLMALIELMERSAKKCVKQQ